MTTIRPSDDAVLLALSPTVHELELMALVASLKVVILRWQPYGGAWEALYDLAGELVALSDGRELLIIGEGAPPPFALNWGSRDAPATRLLRERGYRVVFP